MSLPVLQVEGETVKLIHFDDFDPNGEIAIKYGFRALVLDSIIPDHDVATYTVRLKDYRIDDEHGVALIKEMCRSKNNAFGHPKPTFYLQYDHIQLPDDYQIAAQNPLL